MDILAKLMALPGMVLKFLSGKKTYMIGLSMILMALGGELSALASMDSTMDLLNMIKEGANNPHVKMFLEGLAIMTGRAAIEKMSAPAEPKA